MSDHEASPKADGAESLSTAGLDIDAGWEAFCSAEDIGGDVLTCLDSALVAALLPTGTLEAAYKGYRDADTDGGMPIECVTAALRCAQAKMPNDQIQRAPKASAAMPGSVLRVAKKG